MGPLIVSVIVIALLAILVIARNINQDPFTTPCTGYFFIFDIGITFLSISVIGFSIYKTFAISLAVFAAGLYRLN